MLETEADEDEAGEHEGCGEIDCQETGFRLHGAGVSTHVEFGQGVVDPMASYFPKDGRNDGCEIEESCLRETG